MGVSNPLPNEIRGGRIQCRGAASVWLLFLPALVLLAFALWQRTRPGGNASGYEPPGAPAQVAGAGSVAGWQKSIERSGARLVLRLESLHPTGTRQAFDASVLSERLEEAANGGEPWRLTLSAPTPDAERGPILIESLSDVRVSGMRPLVQPSAQSQATVVRATSDPLATLFALPAGPLHAGEECDVVFWGPAPDPEAILTVTGIGDPIELTPAPRSGSRESLSIATLESNPGDGEPPTDPKSPGDSR